MDLLIDFDVNNCLISFFVSDFLWSDRHVDSHDVLAGTLGS